MPLTATTIHSIVGTAPALHCGEPSALSVPVAHFNAGADELALATGLLLAPAESVELDLLELLHTVTRLKSIPSLRESEELPEAELSDRISLRGPESRMFAGRFDRSTDFDLRLRTLELAHRATF